MLPSAIKNMNRHSFYQFISRISPYDQSDIDEVVYPCDHGIFWHIKPSLQLFIKTLTNILIIVICNHNLY